MIEVGDIVLYHFRAYIRHGDSTLELRTRPAIVTSIEPDNRHLGPANAPGRQLLNLHVFFEFRDIHPREDVHGRAQLTDERRAVPPANVPPANSPRHGSPSDHSWSSKTTSSKRPSWALGDLL